MHGAGASEFPELAPFPGWGRWDLEAGREGNACDATSSIPLIGPSAAQTSGALMGINSGEGKQRVFLKNALSGLCSLERAGIFPAAWWAHAWSCSNEL